METMICNASSLPSDCQSNKGGSRAPGATCYRARSAGCTIALLAVAFLTACDRATSQSQRNAHPKIWEDVSGEKALAHVQTMVDFGPRPPATEAIEKTRTYLIGQLESFGWKVERQNFTENTPRGSVNFVNLIATFGGKDASPSFLACSHYDTKTFDTAQFVGANDGGSSTGLLLELARVLAQRPDLARKMELAFF